jgi:hypothetical protein
MPDMTLPEKVRHNLRWLPTFAWQRITSLSRDGGAVHLIIGLADHFEPSIMPGAPATYAAQDERERRVERWCREYPKVVGEWRDSDGMVFRHTYFFPAEQYEKCLIDRLAEHCRAGWGEIEIHLHHGVDSADTSENTRRSLIEFRDALERHGCLSRADGVGPPRYGFVHGNWALANSAGGRFCGVDDEMQILSETGCYADFTLPSAPYPTQIGKINSLYECALPLDRRAPHRRGRNLMSGRAPRIFPLIIQGPLMLTLVRRKQVLPFPYIENGALTSLNPASMTRLRLWRRAAITVRGCPDWIFIKLHCHGMDPRDGDAMIGASMRQFLRELAESTRKVCRDYVHFVTMREMVNIILAACDGRSGNPKDFRDYRLKLVARSDETWRVTDTESAVGLSGRAAE